MNVPKTHDPEEDLIKQANQYVIDDNGKGWMAQRAVSREINVPQSTFNDWIRKQQRLGQLSLNENNQLDAKSVVLSVSHFAEKGNKEAVEFQSKLALAGVEVYIYGMLGKEYQVRTARMIQADKAIEYRLKLIENNQKLLTDENNELKHEIRSMKVNTHAKRLLHKEWVKRGWLLEHKTHNIKYNYKITTLGRKYLQQYNSHIEEN